ncbi:hypothetical protein [Streptomyces sp. NPDC057257]|uniref:hypothetical protein n=1 Tax=Streptomyces sp. NPDC057257 TaxID=3346071 RepID=UPI003636ABC7
MAGAGRRRGGANSRCPACGGPTHHHRANHSVPFNTVVDLTPLTPAEQAAVREPNRLIYCLTQRPHGPPQLRLLNPWHPPDCPHGGIHVTDHRCPPTTLF